MCSGEHHLNMTNVEAGALAAALRVCDAPEKKRQVPGDALSLGPRWKNSEILTIRMLSLQGFQCQLWVIFFNILGNFGMMSVAKGRESQKTV